MLLLVFFFLRVNFYMLWVVIVVNPELHVIEGIPQLIFVRSSYTIEVQSDYTS